MYPGGFPGFPGQGPMRPSRCDPFGGGYSDPLGRPTQDPSRFIDFPDNPDMTDLRVPDYDLVGPTPPPRSMPPCSPGMRDFAPPGQMPMGPGSGNSAMHGMDGQGGLMMGPPTPQRPIQPNGDFEAMRKQGIVPDPPIPRDQPPRYL